MNSGANHTQAVDLRNEGDQPVRIHARIDDWYLTKDGTPQFKLADTSEFSCTSWVRLNPADQELAPHGTGTVRFTTTAPANSPEAGYRCAIMFDFLPPGGDLKGKGRDVVFQSRIATLVYVTIGSPVPSVELTNLQTRTGAGKRLEIVASLANKGNVHVRLKGKASILTLAGDHVRDIELPNVPVLPKSDRDVAIPVEGEPLPGGQYKVEVRIDIGQPELIVGETALTVEKSP